MFGAKILKMNETNAALLKNHRFKEKYCRKHQSLDADIPKYVGLRENKVQMLLLLAKKQHKFVVHSAANENRKVLESRKTENEMSNLGYVSFYGRT